MKSLFILIKRNIKLYFKDKAMFFVSLITPGILLLLYTTFLRKVFEDSFTASLINQNNFTKSQIETFKPLIKSFVSGQLVSSLLAVSCVTVAFCSNGIMIFDKFSGSAKDFNVSPISKSKIALSYYLASLISTLIICYGALALGLIYMAIVGWELLFTDVLWLILDVFILTNFGTALSSCIHYFLKTQGQMSAVGTIVSSVYGFVCGAYMPISNFPIGLQKALSLLPGTYGTVIFRYHSMNTILGKFNFPEEVNPGILASVDASIKFFGTEVKLPMMYVIVVGTTLLLIGIYILLNVLNNKKAKAN